MAPTGDGVGRAGVSRTSAWASRMRVSTLWVAMRAAAPSSGFSGAPTCAPCAVLIEAAAAPAASAVQADDGTSWSFRPFLALAMRLLAFALVLLRLCSVAATPSLRSTMVCDHDREYWRAASTTSTTPSRTRHQPGPNPPNADGDKPLDDEAWFAAVVKERSEDGSHNCRRCQRRLALHISGSTPCMRTRCRRRRRRHLQVDHLFRNQKSMHHTHGDPVHAYGRGQLACVDGPMATSTQSPACQHQPEKA